MARALGALAYIGCLLLLAALSPVLLVLSAAYEALGDPAADSYRFQDF